MLVIICHKFIIVQRVTSNYVQSVCLRVADDMKVDAGCPDKTWFGTDGQCVKLSLAQLPRVESQAICRTLGGDLYRPTSSEELDEVFNIKADIYSAVG